MALPTLPAPHLVESDAFRLFIDFLIWMVSSREQFVLVEYLAALCLCLMTSLLICGSIYCQSYFHARHRRRVERYVAEFHRGEEEREAREAHRRHTARVARARALAQWQRDKRNFRP